MDKSQSVEINRPLILGVLIFGAFVTVLNQTLMLVAIPPIMRDFDISAAQAQWVTTAFMLTNGIFIPVSAALIDRYSSRYLYLTAITLFLLGTALGAIAQTFPQLLTARIIQGMAAGIAMPLAQTVIMSLFPPHRRGTAMGLVGLVIAFAPAIGPTLSGWLIDQLSWRYLFIVLLPFVVLGLIAAWWVMADVTEYRDSRIDPLSVSLSTLGWGGLLYGFSMAGTVGWNQPSVIGALLIGVVALSLFIPQQLRMDKPMLEFRVFQAPMYRLTTGISIIVFTLLIGPQTLLPIYVQNARGFGALQTGLLLLPGAVVMGLMSPIAGRLFDRFGIRWLAIGGLLLMCIGLGHFVTLGPETPLSRITVGFILHMLGISTLMMSLITAGINASPPHLIAHATAMNNTLRMVGASIGTAVLVSIMSARTATLADLPTELALIGGLRTAFVTALCLALAGLVLAFRLRDQPS
ncbi:DHA2 family efflux MFS transporter permease subunit [Natronospirillum operosum]|uniref:DHA2 family efflux MFS transporter permease subunit n=1 Tax=Natronospirillum operosum TaxID=2759953 RepID=A0A4Z0W9H5_9GAMM|nr:MDR family MFS transporter [Natronospirillum operosum]TGG94267.1 DHA2 family efflux MFS transporter permease subunit [Natronospirillum operosum]